MSNIEAVYIMLNALIFIPIVISIFFAVSYILKTIKLHKFKEWYTKQDLYKSIIKLVLLGLAFLFLLDIHGTGTAPSKANDLAQEAFAAMSTSIMIYRTAFMYLVITPVFITGLFYLYKTVFIVIKRQKQKRGTNELNLLKALKTENSLSISNKFETYINDQDNNETTRLSYEDDAFILKCLNKNNKHNLASKMAHIIENKQKHRNYQMKINRQYMGDKI